MTNEKGLEKKITLGIIIDTSLLIPPNTGVTYRLYFLSKKLTEMGINVKIFLCNRNIKNNKDTKNLFENSLLEYHVIPKEVFYSVDQMLEIVSKHNIDILQFEDSISLIKYKKIWETLKIPTCLEMHDVESTLKELLGFRSKEIKNTEKIASYACNLADKVVCMTPLDFNELIKKIGVDKNKLEIVPNPIDIKYFPFSGPYLRSPNIIFLANMFYWPNQNAVRYISKEIYPKIIKKIKNVRFYLVGMIPNDVKKELQKNNFIFTGSVKNIGFYLKRTILALCPVKEGSGMKVKILNYCAAGLPIITTRIGASGYEKVKSLIIEDNLNNYLDIIIKLLSNNSKLITIGKKNRNYVEKLFDINKLAQKTVKIYKSIIKDYVPDKNNYGEIKLSLPLWLRENRTSKINNKNYYIIKNGKVIFREKIA